MNNQPHRPDLDPPIKPLSRGDLDIELGEYMTREQIERLRRENT